MTAFNSKEYGSSFINWNISELLLCICCAVKDPVLQLTADFLMIKMTVPVIFGLSPSWQ